MLHTSSCAAWCAAACCLAQAQVTKLNEPLARDAGAAGGDVWSAEVAPDGSWVVYLADADTNELFELYGRPTDASAPARKLSSGGDARFQGQALFSIDPSGARVVYLDDPGAAALLSAPIDGSAPAVRLNGPLTPIQRIESRIHFTPDGSRVVYRSDEATPSLFELWSVPSDGSAAPVRLSGALAPGGGVRSAFSPHDRVLAPDGARVFYLAAQDAAGVFELCSAPVDGSATPLRLSTPGTGFVDAAEFSPGGGRIVFVHQPVRRTRSLPSSIHQCSLGSSKGELRIGSLTSNWFMSSGRRACEPSHR